MNFTDEELLLLDIKRIIAPGRGSQNSTAYIYKCPDCKRPVKKQALILDRPIYCNICKADALKKRQIAKKQAELDKIQLDSIDTADANKKVRFKKAADKMEKYKGYEAAISKAKVAYSKYGSIPEAIAAITLLHSGHRVIAQQPVSGYTIDFVLPDYKIALEIDGSIYHADAEKEEIRDYLLKHNLGDGWEIIHIPADSITKRPIAFENLINKKISIKIQTA